MPIHSLRGWRGKNHCRDPTKTQQERTQALRFCTIQSAARGRVHVRKAQIFPQDRYAVRKKSVEFHEHARFRRLYAVASVSLDEMSTEPKTITIPACVFAEE